MRARYLAASGRSFVAAPTAFVSHARAYKFAELVAAVEDFAASQPNPEEVYVWLDVFSQSQHWLGEVGSAERPCNWDVVFQLTTAAIGHTCLIFSPWRDAVPLRRAWILWEALCTVAAGGEAGGRRLSVQLPPTEAADFEAALVTEFDAIATAVSRVDSRRAVCFTPDDEAMIHDAIERRLTGGHRGLDALLAEALRGWLASRGRAALARLPEEERGTSKLPQQPRKASTTSGGCCRTKAICRARHRCSTRRWRRGA